VDLDDVTLELRTREQVRVALTEFPLLESDQERVNAARRLIRHAGKEIGAKVRTVHVRHLGAVFGYVIANLRRTSSGSSWSSRSDPPTRQRKQDGASLPGRSSDFHRKALRGDAPNGSDPPRVCAQEFRTLSTCGYGDRKEGVLSLSA
jgi:hypothetical protein